MLKEKLRTTPILRGPIWELPLHIHKNASYKVVGVALGQVEDKFPYVIYFISKNLSKPELNCILTEKELLVMVHYLNKFRYNTIGYQTFVQTFYATIK